MISRVVCLPATCRCASTHASAGACLSGIPHSAYHPITHYYLAVSFTLNCNLTTQSTSRVLVGPGLWSNVFVGCTSHHITSRHTISITCIEVLACLLTAPAAATQRSASHCTRRFITSKASHVTCPRSRNNNQYWRNPFYNAIRYMFAVLMGLLLGAIYWDMGTKRCV